MEENKKLTQLKINNDLDTTELKNDARYFTK